MIIRIQRKTSQCRVRPLWPSAAQPIGNVDADGHKDCTLQVESTLAVFNSLRENNVG